MPWRVEGTAAAGVGLGMPGAAWLARAGLCPPAEGAGKGRVGRAGSRIARGRCGSCFTRGSRVAVNPLCGRQCGATLPSTRFGEPPLCATARRKRGSGCPRLP